MRLDLLLVITAGNGRQRARSTARRRTDDSVLELSYVSAGVPPRPRFPPSARAALLSQASPWRKCSFYFGVLRRVAKGNTGGVTGEEEGGEGGAISETRDWSRRPRSACARPNVLSRFCMNINASRYCPPPGENKTEETGGWFGLSACF